MFTVSIVLWTGILGQNPGSDAGHSRNTIYRALRVDGMMIEGKPIVFPEPILQDGQSADAQRSLIRGVAGSERAVQELLRDSVTAPFVLKVHDETSPEGDLIRGGSLWFAIHADLDAINPDAWSGPGATDQPIEAGNMRIEARMLDAKELAARGIEQPDQTDTYRSGFIHTTGRLLDRIHVETTARSMATRSSESWVVASRTETKFDQDEAFPNLWRTIERQGGRETLGPVRRYAGGASYVKISRLALAPGMLLVEAHFHFAEPRAWFDGAPILRSKFGVVAQDQIRHLRRELAKSRAK